MVSLAATFLSIGRCHEAETLQAQALEISQNTLGLEHMCTLVHLPSCLVLLNIPTLVKIDIKKQ